MGFSATVSSALSTAWSGIETGVGFVYNEAAAGLGWAGHSIQATVSGPVVNTVASVWTSAGPILGPAALIIGIGASALIGNHFWHKPKPEDSTFATVAFKVTGLALAVLAGAATAGFVGVAAGTVGVAAYVAGGAVTVGSLVL